ncbi:unnamed protein product, partial [Linum tenue]
TRAPHPLTRQLRTTIHHVHRRCKCHCSWLGKERGWLLVLTPRLMMQLLSWLLLMMLGGSDSSNIHPQARGLIWLLLESKCQTAAVVIIQLT